MKLIGKRVNGLAVLFLGVGLSFTAASCGADQKGSQLLTDDIASQAQDYDWRTDIEFSNTKTYAFNGNTHGSAYYKDIMTHMRKPYLSGGTLTAVHESLHFLQHEYGGPAGTKFIYYRNGKGAYFPEPGIKTVTAEQYIPRSIAQSSILYKNYVKKRPTQVLGENLFDEWKAYITESSAMVEIFKAGNTVNIDIVEGSAAEFLYFCSASMVALQKHEPEHLNKPNVKAIFAMLAEETRWIYDNVIEMDQIKHTHFQELMVHMQTDPEGEDVRKALKDIYGPAWTNRVLGF